MTDGNEIAGRVEGAPAPIGDTDEADDDVGDADRFAPADGEAVV